VNVLHLVGTYVVPADIITIAIFVAAAAFYVYKKQNMKDKIHSAASYAIFAILELLLVILFVSMIIVLFGINVPVPVHFSNALGILVNLLVISGIIYFITDP
jgi:hypothetical protein